MFLFSCKINRTQARVQTRMSRDIRLTNIDQKKKKTIKKEMVHNQSEAIP